MKEDLKEIFLIGLGAISMTGEKANNLKDELLKKGEELYKSGKVLNEELKHNIKERIKDNVTVVVNEEKDITKEDIFNNIEKLTDKEKQELASILEKDNKEK